MQRSRLAALLVLAMLASGWMSTREASASPTELRVMTFNVWVAENTAGGRAKLRDILQVADADIVGLQEMGAGQGQAIADALGYHYHQQSGGDIQVLSRHPVVGASPANRGVRIELSPDQHVWLFNAHYAAYPYQPYDLRDGKLAEDEAAVIAAADQTRGGQVTHDLNDMQQAFASGEPMFLTGDFNEPSHLDWTQEAADATDRDFDLKVEYPTSKRFADAGFVDSFRAVRPDEVNDPAYTWTPGTPPPNISANEVHDRIDIVYHRGPGLTPQAAFNIGIDAGNINTDIAVEGYNADHRAVVVDYLLAPPPLAGDLDGDGLLDGSDWQIFIASLGKDLSDLTADQAYAQGDLTGDMRVNHADFVMFRELYDQTHGSGAFDAARLAVPEPGLPAMMLMGVLCLVHRRRTEQRRASRAHPISRGG